jgi:putative addiction module component (TIGR02574 family)
MDTESVTVEALKLPVAQRTRLIEDLLRSLNPAEQASIDESWLAESRRRYAEFKEGKVVAVDGEKALAEIARELRG